ncbi:CCA tRNA nucleotidyltransferase [Pseudalkalibacillus salsuginis]|uniref:CCA tRNA nucleotidyltransferase n=1 Tax=Pseudalkalibacillus salsuginis TaxID=2910972 RepID=UPI001F25FDE0|nr:CCA tRNA nucleotidyltransferase [Pseudalkalibacillus salsuginis]MCF6408210.1 CCA tRNA nucleotidyltransferase [Pseudalkalibacillus salsuginis]
MSFKLANQVVEKLQNHGFKAYIVGGVVRDRLLRRPTGDIDIATSAKPEEVQRIFPKTIPVGIEHGTVIVRHGKQSFEVTTFRSEGRYIDHRRPSEVEFHESIEADLSRRDFTINSLALDRNGGIIDPFGGKEDLEQGILKAVGTPSERFQEDPLRMMRGIRFVSILGFGFEETTYSALVENAFLLKKISVERIRDEFEKMLGGPYCEKALTLLKKTNVDCHLPRGPFEFQVQTEKFHWSELTTVEERWTGFLARNQIEDPVEWLSVWKLPNQRKAKVDRIVKLVRSDIDFTCAYTLYTYGLSDLKATIRVKRFLGLLVEIEESELVARFSQLPIKSRAELAINGNELQKFFRQKPGPWITEYLEKIERCVIEGKVENTPSGVKELIEKWQQPYERN